ncbi:integrase [Serratia fonticola]|nr:integrase [Serratia fonticola]
MTGKQAGKPLSPIAGKKTKLSDKNSSGIGKNLGLRVIYSAIGVQTLFCRKSSLESKSQSQLKIGSASQTGVVMVWMGFQASVLPCERGCFGGLC